MLSECWVYSKLVRANHLAQCTICILPFIYDIHILFISRDHLFINRPIPDVGMKSASAKWLIVFVNPLSPSPVVAIR